MSGNALIKVSLLFKDVSSLMKIKVCKIDVRMSQMDEEFLAYSVEVQIFLKQMFRSLLNSYFLPKISFFLNKSIINVEFQIKSINESLIGPLKTFIELGAQKVLNL